MLAYDLCTISTKHSLLDHFRNFVDVQELVGHVDETVKQRTSGRRAASMKRPQWREKQYYCPKCNRGFTLKSNLKRHYTYECGFKPRFKCPYCDLRSKQTSQVYSHIRNKHPGRQVRFVNVDEVEE
ncbi:hypothetical protein TSAR_003219 [Trichomalopsis sarcophagae]|uniref:C2H2-type domain-containing protein n=1 Tax=Trichomalopsis sarcophagae TaxID=543379 RepID=A0A232EYY0_9HYME|nr:hypothetical protein TSAR_003219 [Trichomalopsis sarcophagae]